MEWFGLEHGILYGLERARNDSATSRIILLTFLGQWQLVIAMATTLAIPLLRIKNPNGPAAAKGLVLSIVLCIGITELTKRIVSRERPDIVSTAGNYTKPESASFPSGHASCSMAFALALLLAMKRIQTPFKWQLLAWPLLVGFGIGIGITRLYLGVHWPTDIIAGWALGAACALGAFFLTETRETTF
jgi:undecaprenyl-diphosphatase